MASSSYKGLLKGRWTVWGLSLFFSILAGLGVLLIVGKASDRVPYYVVSQPVAPRTPITPDIVRTVEVNADAMPPTALTLEQIQSGQWFAKVPLNENEIVTNSNTGPLTPINFSLPPNYVAASLQVTPEKAVGGKIKAGDYVDIAATNEGKAKVIMQHVLVLDVTVNPSSIAAAATDSGASPTAAPGPESQQVRGGIPQVYTLALSPDNFAKLSLISNGNASLAISSTNTPASLDASATLDQMFGPGGVPDAGKGTGNVFGPSPSASATPTPAPSNGETGTPTPTPSQ